MSLAFQFDTHTHTYNHTWTSVNMQCIQRISPAQIDFEVPHCFPGIQMYAVSKNLPFTVCGFAFVPKPLPSLHVVLPHYLITSTQVYGNVDTSRSQP